MTTSMLYITGDPVTRDAIVAREWAIVLDACLKLLAGFSWLFDVLATT